VVDNLNTHTPAALYGAFPPDEARRITRQLEFHEKRSGCPAACGGEE